MALRTCEECGERKYRPHFEWDSSTVCRACDDAKPKHCRAGLPLGATGPGDCREPVISEDESADLGISRRFCLAHARILAEAKRSMKGRERAPVVSHAPAAPKVEKLPKHTRAARAARAVHAAGWLSKTDAAAAAGFEGSTGGFGRVARYAREQGWIESKRRGTTGGFVAGQVAPPPEDADGASPAAQAA